MAVHGHEGLRPGLDRRLVFAAQAHGFEVRAAESVEGSLVVAHADQVFGHREQPRRPVDALARALHPVDGLGHDLPGEPQVAALPFRQVVDGVALTGEERLLDLEPGEEGPGVGEELFHGRVVGREPGLQLAVV